MARPEQDDLRTFYKGVGVGKPQRVVQLSLAMAAKLIPLGGPQNEEREQLPERARRGSRV